MDRHMNRVRVSTYLAASAGLAWGGAANGQNTPEIEPNQTKAQATVVLDLMQPGHTLSGNSQGSSTTGKGPTSADTFRIRTALTGFAIYRYRLVLITVGTAGHVCTIRGVNQIAAAQAPWPGAVGTAGVADVTLQQSSPATTPARFVQWYGFGKGEELYYRVAGTAATTGDYTATLERTTITPANIGSFPAGSLTISTLGQGHTTDTELWVYNGNFDPISGYANDDEAASAISGVPGTTGGSVQSVLKRNYTPGTYFVAVSNFSTANNLGSPCDDDFRGGPLMDFPGAICNDIATPIGNLQFSIGDGVNPAVVVPNTHSEPYIVTWFAFTVTGAGGGCYANCDGSTGTPLLTGNDFQCFADAFAAGLSTANCDGSTGTPALTGNDFQCFANAFAAGCS